MTELDDHGLLARFARENSEAAFAVLVERHVNLVYATALRSVGSAHAAEEIAQVVFIILAKKAGKLSPSVVISGWLYQTARLTAANFLRSEISRQKREQEAFMQSTFQETAADSAWRQIAPVLDDALGQLGERDRNAIVLRFFENQNLRAVGQALGSSEDAAKMRVNRALEKLRKILGKRGVALSAVALAGAVSGQFAQAAPVGLAKAISVVAALPGATAAGSTISLVNGVMKFMIWTKIKTALWIGVGVAVAILAVRSAATRAFADSQPAVVSTPAPPASKSITNDQPGGSIIQKLMEKMMAAVNPPPGGPPPGSREEALQKSFQQFPFLMPITNGLGQPEFETLTLTNALHWKGKQYFGFRFQVPRRTNNEDLVWSFVEPENYTGWYIIPQTGDMNGFVNYFYNPRDFFTRADGLWPANGRRVMFQSLSGESLEDGQNYLIWFGFNSHHPARMSLAFTFAHLETNSFDSIGQVMGLDCENYLERPLSPPVVNPNNHHTYILLRAATWKKSERRAVLLGGHLATVRNSAEEDWIFKTFGKYGGQQRLLWIGLSDRDKKFHFSWSSGESASYANWARHEPNNAGRGEDYVSIYYPNHDEANRWNDWSDRATDPIGLPMNGVVEIIPNTPDNLASAATPAAEAGAVPIQPNIVITCVGNSIKLQWPVTMPGYMLEATTNLSRPFKMFGYSELTNLEAGMLYVTITNPVPQMFFRLRSP